MAHRAVRNQKCKNPTTGQARRCFNPARPVTKFQLWRPDPTLGINEFTVLTYCTWKEYYASILKTCLVFTEECPTAFPYEFVWLFKGTSVSNKRLLTPLVLNTDFARTSLEFHWIRILKLNNWFLLFLAVISDISYTILYETEVF